MNLFTFDDVLIEPRFSFIRSRKDVNTSSYLLGKNLTIPVVSSNMDTVTTVDMAHAMATNGAISCLHRFQSLEANCRQFQESVHNGVKPLVSIGLGKKEFERACALIESGAEIIVIDVAHGANIAVVEQYVALRDKYGENVGIVVGNFATNKSITDFNYHSPENLEAVKVGIGNGAACTTRIKTGVGIPQLSAILDCARSGLEIIGDGGCKNAGDVVKSIAAGASVVMLGRLLAGTFETPDFFRMNGHTGLEYWTPIQHSEWQKTLPDYISDNAQSVKLYRGSASGMSYDVQGKKADWRASEGEAYEVPTKGPVRDILMDINGGLRSAMSYVGASNIEEFQELVNFVHVSNPTIRENGIHGK